MRQTTQNHLGAIAELIQLLPHIKELLTRSHFLQLATITNNDDPLQKRRVKVSTEAMGQQSESYWVQCGRSQSHTDEPIPPVGTTVLIGFVEGDASDGYILRTLANDTNPPDNSQSAPLLDNTEEISGSDRRSVVGDSQHLVAGNHTQTIYGDMTVTCQGDTLSVTTPTGNINISAAGGVGEVSISGDYLVKLQQGGASLVATGGSWVFTNASGQSWVLGGASGSEWSFNMGGATLNIANAGDVQINGKSVAVVGAKDTHSDTLVNRGY